MVYYTDLSTYGIFKNKICNDESYGHGVVTRAMCMASRNTTLWSRSRFLWRKIVAADCTGGICIITVLHNSREYACVT